MRVRVSMGAGVPPWEFEGVQCELCETVVSAAAEPLDGHGHCVRCQEPREVKCEGCDVMTREDLLEHGECPGCQQDAADRDAHAVERLQSIYAR